MKKKKQDNLSVLLSKCKTSEFSEDPKFSAVPKVCIERCSFSNFLDKNSSNSESISKKLENVESSQLPQVLGAVNLLKPVSSTQKKRNLNTNVNILELIPVVHLERCNELSAHEKHVHLKQLSNREGYQSKRKHNSNANDRNFGTSESRIHNKTLQCINLDKKESTKSILKQQRNYTKVLRERKKVDYKERLSIGTPEITRNTLQTNGRRIPIYNQLNFLQPVSKEQTHKQYDFIPDSDEDKGSDFSFHIETPAKKRKIIKIVHSSKQRANATNINQIDFMKTKKVTKLVKYKDKIENIVNNIRSKVNKRNDNINVKASNQIKKNEGFQSEQNVKTNLYKKRKNDFITMEIMFNSTCVPNTPNISMPNESRILCNEERATHNNVKMNQLISELDVTTEFIRNESNYNTQNIPLHIGYPTSSNQRNPSENNINPNVKEVFDRHQENFSNCARDTRNLVSGRSSCVSNYAHDDSDVSDGELFQCYSSKNEMHISDRMHDANKLFGFDEDIEENTQNQTTSTGRVKLIQNLVLTKSNHTNLNTSAKGWPTRSSWRFDTNYVTRNPHFIDLKKDGLPSLNQDPVLDHTFDDRIKEVNTTITVHRTKKSPKQKSILNFVETDKEHSVKNHHQPSLYNIDEYSPIKTKTADREDFDENRVENLRRSSRRNVLEQINENIMISKTSTPAKYKHASAPIHIDLSLIEHEGKQEVRDFSNFGFDSSSEIIENEKNDSDKENAAKPFRLEMNLKKKKTKKYPEKITQPVRDSDVRRLVGNDSEFIKLLEDEGLECAEVGLFEDAEASHNITKCYKPRTRKKNPVTRDNLNKKDVECKLSKKAQKWIKEFNKMCDEVDSIELEIE